MNLHYVSVAYLFVRNSNCDVYVLCEACTSLPLEKDGSNPNTVIRVRSYKKSDDTTAYSTVGLTDVIQVSLLFH